MPEREGREADRDREVALHPLGVCLYTACRVDLVARQRGQQLFEQDPPLEARDVLAQACVRAVPEGQHPRQAAADVEGVGVLELALVAVRRGVEEHHRLPGAQLFAVDLDVPN